MLKQGNPKSLSRAPLRSEKRFVVSHVPEKSEAFEIFAPDARAAAVIFFKIRPGKWAISVHGMRTRDFFFSDIVEVFPGAHALLEYNAEEKKKLAEQTMAEHPVRAMTAEETKKSVGRTASVFISILMALLQIPVVAFVFFICTYGNILTWVPLVIFLFQLYLLIRKKKYWYLLVIALNPAFLLPVKSVSFAVVQYAQGTPSIRDCAYTETPPAFDATQNVFIHYDDDDCDWEGADMYTHDIIRGVTFALIDLWGNPTDKKRMDTSEG